MSTISLSLLQPSGDTLVTLHIVLSKHRDVSTYYVELSVDSAEFENGRQRQKLKGTDQDIMMLFLFLFNYLKHRL